MTDAERRFFNCECGLTGGCEKCMYTDLIETSTANANQHINITPRDYVIAWGDWIVRVEDHEDEQHD